MTNILVESIRPEVKLITLNRPDRLNALTFEMMDEFYELLNEIEHDPDCRVVILTGAGRGFCAGIDLTAVSDGSTKPAWLKNNGDGAGLPEWPQRRDQGNGSSAGVSPQAGLNMFKYTWAPLAPRMRALRQPIIAAVNGAAAGGGFVLALASDIRVASTSALFYDAFAKVGASGCELGLSWLLPRHVGWSRAAEMMLTGRQVGGEEAERMGLVHRVVADGEVVEAALEVAERIVANTPLGVRMTKEVMWSAQEITALNAVIDLELRSQLLCLMTEDSREQVQAVFFDKRPPVYRNL